MGSDCSFPRRARRTGRDFNPRSPDGERLTFAITVITQHSISIHAPRMGSDPQSATNAPSRYISIHAPRMGSDLIDGDVMVFDDISIHAPRMGSDVWNCKTTYKTRDFNPRSPDGERHTSNDIIHLRFLFQSTLPGWGATYATTRTHWPTRFQSTLPGWGATTVGSLVPLMVS